MSIAGHTGVSRSEIEGVFAGPVIVLPDPAIRRMSAGSGVSFRTGGGRPVFVVFTILERGGRRYIRPVSARYMHREEIESYEKENPDL